MIELEYWSAEWCGPCKLMKPILKDLEASGITITQMDADDNIELAKQNRIAGVPTVIIKKDGQEVDRIVGAKDRQTFLARIRKIQ